MGQPSLLLLAFALAYACSSVAAQQTCANAIAPCEVNRCATQTLNGQASVKVCLRCSGLYQPSKNSLNCVCPLGYYERCSESGGKTTCACLACERGFYCPGGDTTAMNGNSVNRGRRFSCHKSQENMTHTTATVEALGLTTKSQKSVKHLQCFPMPGYYLPALSASQQAAVLCPKNKYSPGFARLRQCLKCPGGLEEDPSFTDQAGGAQPAAGDYFNASATFVDSTNTTVTRVITKLRSDRIETCLVPAGKYLSSGSARACPSGSWRTGYLNATAQEASYCNKCPAGVSTPSVGSTSESDCSVGMAGYDIIMEVDPVTNQTIARPCPRGTYYAGGLLPADRSSTCTRCPLGTDTQYEGSTSTADCKVPPGYFIRMMSDDWSIYGPGPWAPEDGILVKCPTYVDAYIQGFYRAGWTIYSTVSVRERASGDGSSACTPCGTMIRSEYTDIDEWSGANNANKTEIDTTSRVATSSQSCYIEPGMGMAIRTFEDRSEYVAFTCPPNSYGVSERFWGLAYVPCKSCGRNLVSSQGSTSIDACTNPPGYSFDAGQALQCPAGFYNSAGSKKTCLACPEGRTTDVQDAANNQNDINDCYVKPGYGLILISDPTVVLDVANIAVDSAEHAAVPCPVGYYSTGGGYMQDGTMVINAVCNQCAEGHTTEDAGTAVDNTVAADLRGVYAGGACTVCAEGYAKTNVNGTETCSKCAYGTYSAANQWGSAGTCQTCPSKTFAFLANDEPVEPVTGSGTTLRAGATKESECVTSEQQFSEDVGAALLEDGLYSAAAAAGFGGISTVQSLANCKAMCTSNAKACFYEYRYSSTNNNCRHLELALADQKAMEDYTLSVPGTRPLLFVKLLPSSALSAASIANTSGNTSGNNVKGKMTPSGYYARLEYETAMESMNAELGTATSSSSIAASPAYNSPASPYGCMTNCDQDATCWGFTVTFNNYDSANQLNWLTCTLRTGKQVTNARAMFKLPDSASVNIQRFNMWRE